LQKKSIDSKGVILQGQSHPSENVTSSSASQQPSKSCTNQQAVCHMPSA